ncbi:unnamed protein product [Arctogadus glacialis]
MNMSWIENFNEEQKLYLLHCIRGVVDTVENARKDTTTTLRRKAVWDNLANSFNIQCRFPSRSPSSPAHLKNVWKRLKVEARKAIAERTNDLQSERPPTPASSSGVSTPIHRQAQRHTSSRAIILLPRRQTPQPTSSTITASQASDAQPVDPNQSLSSTRILLPQRQTLQPTSSTITASQSAQPDRKSPASASSSEAQGTPSTTREPEYGESSGSDAGQPAPERMARAVRQRALPRFEQHMLQMSRELKMELIRAQACRDEEVHGEQRKALRAKRKAYDAKMR